jgi:diaminohydroxyphosphoribosylaminopyrimidine deaminase/5-amino-6-(5-phosphoribosylamino)uracil reductase
MQSQAYQLNAGFCKRMEQGLPRVNVKMAVSMDGKIALLNGQSKWITGALARRDVQRHRAKSCAILSGSDTVIIDDPSLNVRPDELNLENGHVYFQTNRQPLKVILDGRNRITGQEKLFSLSGNVVVMNRKHNAVLFSNTDPSKVQQFQIATAQGKLNLKNVLTKLAELGCNDVWVEAGPTLAGALIQQELVDSLILYQAPKLLGNNSVDAFTLTELQNLQDAKQMHIQDIRQLGNDVRITASLVNQRV